MENINSDSQDQPKTEYLVYYKILLDHGKDSERAKNFKKNIVDPKYLSNLECLEKIADSLSAFNKLKGKSKN